MIVAWRRLVLVLLVTIALIWVSAGCSVTTPTDTKVIIPVDLPELPPRGFFMGLLPIPGEGQSFAEAYQKTSSCADFTPVWGRPTPFYDLAQELSGDWGETFVEQYTRGNGLFPLVHMSFIGTGMALIVPSGMSGATLQSPEWRQTYKEAAIDVVRAIKPLYLSLGNEVNRWYEQYGADDSDPNSFQNYISLYEEIYDAVKQLSPQTKVFCTFAREIISQYREADLTVLQMFNADKIDLLVFTSYPYAVQGINHPSDIPADYYSSALDYMPGKPFGFSEVGWSALDAFGGEKGQADFINLVATHLTVDQGIDLQLLGWPWLNALDASDSISLIKKDGTERLAYAAWQKLFDEG